MVTRAGGRRNLFGATISVPHLSLPTRAPPAPPTAPLGCKRGASARSSSVRRCRCRTCRRRGGAQNWAIAIECPHPVPPLRRLAPPAPPTAPLGCKRGGVGSSSARRCRCRTGPASGVVAHEVTTGSPHSADWRRKVGGVGGTSARRSRCRTSRRPRGLRRLPPQRRLASQSGGHRQLLGTSVAPRCVDLRGRTSRRPRGLRRLPPQRRLASQSGRRRQLLGASISVPYQSPPTRAPPAPPTAPTGVAKWGASAAPRRVALVLHLSPSMRAPPAPPSAPTGVAKRGASAAPRPQGLEVDSPRRLGRCPISGPRQWRCNGARGRAKAIECPHPAPPLRRPPARPESAKLTATAPALSRHRRLSGAQGRLRAMIECPHPAPPRRRPPAHPESAKLTATAPALSRQWRCNGARGRAKAIECPHPAPPLRRPPARPESAKLTATAPALSRHRRLSGAQGRLRAMIECPHPAPPRRRPPAHPESAKLTATAPALSRQWRCNGARGQAKAIECPQLAVAHKGTAGAPYSATWLPAGASAAPWGLGL